MLCLHPRCGLNGVPTQRALPQRQGGGRREGGVVVMGLSGDCLFVVFTAKPLRTYRHFHQHSAVHSMHFPACVPQFLMSYFLLTLFVHLKKKLYMTPLGPRRHLSVSVRSCNALLLYTHLHEENPVPAVICSQFLSSFSLETALSLYHTNHKLWFLVFRTPSLDDGWLDGRYQHA